ncbi:error-prone DNA polymerase [Pacificimonas flava]|uniref:Error-prone DNA polymerase n=2 Tax=Pacificimonas TaxID=1960290 RepID=A0A219B661_9SPHN|nr:MULTISPECIES: error-prone DNA polymerase [Pacificimonas]MBZ6379513.1 error-prone DNA polymerase [Pacificimonas aurantium]OWV33299.1 error-prone DNA polymerase [Pacificimonas flava]
MPEPPLTPDKRTIANPEDFRANPRAPYVELGLATSFSFLRGASDPIDLVLTAHLLGYDTLGLADRNSLAGAVRHWSEAHRAKIRPLTGCRLDLCDAPSLYAYPRTREGYGRLTALLSGGMMQTREGAWQEKGVCELDLAMVADRLGAPDSGVTLIAVPEAATELDGFAAALPRLVQALPGLSHIAAAYLYRGDDRARINRLQALAVTHGLKLVAVNDVLYHTPQRRPLQDILTCIREKCTIFEAGTRLLSNAERHLKTPAEMQQLFADWPGAVAETRAIADACTFDLRELHYEYPEETVPEGQTPEERLADLTWVGALGRYPEGIPQKVRSLVTKELALIAKMDIARYFLTIYDIVTFARGEGILCQGRGSAANSAVCYCLGITAVDPAKHDLLFERFISEERREPPDIDVDFEHERREEVIQHIYRRYGRTRAGLCATVIHYRPRMAIREVGKAMGLSEDVTAALARTVWGSWGSSVDEDKVAEAGLDLSDPHLKRTIALADQLIGMPRHLSQHVGGFILTQGPLVETVPVGNGAMPDRSFIEWDKDDIDALGIMKIDVLALGMLTCIRKCFDILAAQYGRRLTLAAVPEEDPATYAMLQKGDSLGVFQVESRAQMNMLPRLKPAKFYDLVIEVAIVRPGPIQGDMVHPYLRRRQGKEPVVYPYPSPEHGPRDELQAILGRTLGVPIFQEQAMKIAMVAAEFSPEEANQLRKAMATFRSKGMVSEHKDKMVSRMIGRGYDPEFAARCFSQIEGFGEYGFPESHAASFAHLVYVSSWLKCHYPAAFAAALLNSQPMGFYAPAQIVRDAREHGVDVRAADVNMSDWDNVLEPQAGGPPGSFALRLGLRQVDGLKEADAARLLTARQRPYSRIAELKERAGMGVPSIERLAAADTFRSLGLDRRQALWDARALKGGPDLPLFTAAETADEGEDVPVLLPAMPLCEHVVSDYQTTRLSLKAHPMQFLRARYEAERFTKAADLRRLRFGQRVSISGVVLIRQRPGSAKGVVFITLEDETGVVNLVVWPDALQAYRKTVMGARLMAVHGTVQMDDAVIHVVAREMLDHTNRLSELSDDMLRQPLARADHVVSPLPSQVAKHPRNVQVIPRSRDFH